MGFEGGDGATATADESASARTITFVGAAQIDTAQFKYGASSLLLDGSGDYLTAPDSADWQFAGEFTIEAFVRISNLAGSAIISQYAIGNLSFSLETTAAGQARLRYSTDGSTVAHDITTTGTALTTATWYHFAVDRDAGGKMRVYIDGVMRGSKTGATGTNFNAAVPLDIGRRASGALDHNGHLDEVRITNGVARYASDDGFTPPAAAFPRS
jgi:hypothetical protein